MFRLAAHFRILDVDQLARDLPADKLGEWKEFAREEAFDLASAVRILVSTAVNTNPFRQGQSIKPGDAVPYGWIEATDFTDEGTLKPPPAADSATLTAKLSAWADRVNESMSKQGKGAMWPTRSTTS